MTFYIILTFETRIRCPYVCDSSHNAKNPAYVMGVDRFADAEAARQGGNWASGRNPKGPCT